MFGSSFAKFMEDASTRSGAFSASTMSFEMKESVVGPITKEKFASLVRVAFDDQIKDYYAEMASTEDADIAGRTEIMDKYQKQPYGLVLVENGICTGFNRTSSTVPAPAAPPEITLSQADKARAAMARKSKLLRG